MDLNLPDMKKDNERFFYYFFGLLRQFNLKKGGKREII